MTAQPATPPQALGDLRVLELSDEKGQLCGKLLADLGADVIKVEPPEGCSTRRIGPFYEDQPDHNRSLYFWHYNTSKRSITLNLDTPGGQQLFRRLARTADIVLESNAPGAMASRGLGYDELSRDNPRLIYCAVTPFGQSGPWRDFKASDLTLMASGGEMGICGYDLVDDPDDTPIAPGGGNAYHIGDHYAFVAILLALYNRDLRGNGEHIDLSIHEAIALCTEGSFPEYVMTGDNRDRQTGRHASALGSPPVQFKCKDGRYANCFIPRITPEEWLRLVEWLDENGVAGDLKDDRLLDPEVLRGEMGRVLDAVRSMCTRLTADELFHGGQQRKLPWTVVRAPSDIVDDPHLRDRGFFVEVEHPELGKRFTYPGAPYIFHGTPWRVRRRAPLLGEDNVAVYRREMGMDLATLNALSETGVV